MTSRPATNCLVVAGSAQRSDADRLRRSSYGDCDFSAGVSLSEVVDGFGGLAQWVGPVDDWCDLAGFQEFEGEQVIVVPR